VADPTPHKDHLLSVLAQTVDSAKSLQSQAQDAVEQAKRTGDVAASFKEVIAAAPSDNVIPAPMWAQLTKAWEAQRDQTKEGVRIFQGLPALSATTASVTLTTTLSVATFGPWLAQEGLVAANRFHAVIHRPNETQDALQGIDRFNLNAPGSLGRAPKDLLAEGYQALTRPAGILPSPAAVLIPVREALNTILAALIRRRSVQEPASKHADKVISLGRHCARTNLPSDHFERLAADYVRLQDRLSSSKQAALSPTEVTSRYDEALLFLKALLDSLDSSRLKAN